MGRNIRTLHNFEPPTTREEIHEACRVRADPYEVIFVAGPPRRV
jgi:hypothetical protein